MSDSSLAEIQEDIVELQILTMHQNNTISALDEVIQSQQKLIEKLQSEVRELKDMIGGIGPASKLDLVDERPPHY